MLLKDHQRDQKRKGQKQHTLRVLLKGESKILHMYLSSCQPFLLHCPPSLDTCIHDLRS